MSDQVDLKIRNWEDSDLAAIAALTARLWPSLSRHLSDRFISDYIWWYRLWSNRGQTVTADGEPVGVLLARIKRDYGMLNQFQATLWALRGLVLAALGFFGRPRNRFKLLRTLVATEREAERLLPRSDGEIALLILDEPYHGQGIGRRLVEAFVDHARAGGAKKLALVSDEESNWPFYEHLGWKREKEFPLEFEFYIEGREITGYIYVLEFD